jgi:hypothetical protein
MAWGPEKRAGFALAALLSDDRELTGVAPALEPSLRAQLAQQLAEASVRRADAIAQWLALLRPELGASALALPPRLRGLLAPLTKAPLRGALAAGRPAVRAHFTADSSLLDALLRIARWSARGEVP